MGFGDVDDDYDPAKPNDYMEYCRERINKKKQEERDRELKIIMEEQEREVGWAVTFFFGEPLPVAAVPYLPNIHWKAAATSPAAPLIRPSQSPEAVIASPVHVHVTVFCALLIFAASPSSRSLPVLPNTQISR